MDRRTILCASGALLLPTLVPKAQAREQLKSRHIKGHNMYIVELTYQRPMEAIEAQLQAHRRFLDKYYERGVLLASGPKNPRDGGVIIAGGHVSRAELDAILAEDPFHQHALASYRVIEFNAVKMSAAMANVQ
ncbi:hypothetical protein SDC9_113854 [bioreactor metagenome]|uniref:YCII-related domain-containing protein n=1 Tax=bioreactor metagenome TaxID=1076179 RepID=A0A645BN77_9ZZZZ